ncbi:hypothetical protein V6U77_18640 [Micromonospora sp. CPCC 205546]|uniref:hypothetical protein n=1 Tax=Micromonospora sp. CPCC 205546 TaxID=3122397 RepID=UPI002FF29716
MSRGEWPGDLAVVVVLPDALLSGGVPRIGRILTELGARPVRVRSVRLDAADAVAFYRGRPRSKTSVKGRQFGGLLTRRLFELDSSLVVLLRADGAGEGHGSLTRRLHDAKGPSAYLQQRPGSLRAASRFADRCLSLVHTPDDAEDAALTADRFFADPPATASTDNLRRYAPEEAWEIVQQCRTVPPLTLATSRYAVVPQALLRCVALTLADGVPRRPERLELLADARQRLTGWLAADVCESPGDERKRFGDLIDQLSGADDPLGEAVSPTYAGVVSALLSLPDYDLEWADHIVADLAHHGLHLNDTEIHLLSTLMAFFDD